MGLFDKAPRTHSIEELRETWEECNKCPLRLPEMKVCHGLAPNGGEVPLAQLPSPRIMVVGQSPTRNEAKSGSMMQDKGGQEIRHWIGQIVQQMGGNPEQVFYTNCVKCPAVVKRDFNKPLSFVDRETGELCGESVPATSCSPYLEEEIRLFNPDLIIALGTTTLKRFANYDANKTLPKKLDAARKRLWSYNGHRFVAITMPTRLSDENFDLDEDRDFLLQVFDMKGHKYTPKKQDRMPTVEEVFAAVDSCEKCDLCSTAKSRVFGTGDLNADIVLVGEAPGPDEDEAGVPFIGRAGQVLREALVEAGINHQDIYITNAIKCFPGRDRNNKIKAPEPHQLHACDPYLKAQIKQIKPKVIIPVGSKALRAITGRGLKISRSRGRIDFPCHFYDDAVVVPTWHPSYVMRNMRTSSQVIRKEFIEDLLKAKEIASSK